MLGQEVLHGKTGYLYLDRVLYNLTELVTFWPQILRAGAIVYVRAQVLMFTFPVWLYFYRRTCLHVLETALCYRVSTDPFAISNDLPPCIMFVLLVNISLFAPQ